MHTRSGREVVAVLETTLRAACVLQYIVCVSVIILAALEGVHRSGAAGTDKENNSTIEVRKATCSCVVLCCSEEEEPGKIIGIAEGADFAVVKGVRAGRRYIL